MHLVGTGYEVQLTWGPCSQEYYEKHCSNGNKTSVYPDSKVNRHHYHLYLISTLLGLKAVKYTQSIKQKKKHGETIKTNKKSITITIIYSIEI